MSKPYEHIKNASGVIKAFRGLLGPFSSQSRRISRSLADPDIWRHTGVPDGKTYKKYFPYGQSDYAWDAQRYGWGDSPTLTPYREARDLMGIPSDNTQTGIMRSFLTNYDSVPSDRPKGELGGHYVPLGHTSPATEHARIYGPERSDFLRNRAYQYQTSNPHLLGAGAPNLIDAEWYSPISVFAQMVPARSLGRVPKGFYTEVNGNKAISFSTDDSAKTLDELTARSPYALDLSPKEIEEFDFYGLRNPDAVLPAFMRTPRRALDTLGLHEATGHGLQKHPLVSDLGVEPYVPTEVAKQFKLDPYVRAPGGENYGLNVAELHPRVTELKARKFLTDGKLPIIETAEDFDEFMRFLERPSNWEHSGVGKLFKLYPEEGLNLLNSTVKADPQSNPTAPTPAGSLDNPTKLAAMAGVSFTKQAKPSLSATDIEEIIAPDVEPEETPLRGYEDLKKQYFGPTIFNKQRLWEAGDSLAYQTAYGAPAAIGAHFLSDGDVKATLLGLAVGKLLGQGHLIAKERDRINTALEYFTPTEKKLLKKLDKSSRNWSIGSGLVGGLGAGGIAYGLGADKFGKTATPIIAGLGTALVAALAGNLIGHSLAKNDALRNKKFRQIIQRYDKFN
jgi:hypothetical protein